MNWLNIFGNCIIIFYWSSEFIGMFIGEPGGITGWLVLYIPFCFGAATSGLLLFFPTRLSIFWGYFLFFPFTCGAGFEEIAFVRSTSWIWFPFFLFDYPPFAFVFPFYWVFLYISTNCVIFGWTFMRITYLQSGVSLSYCLQSPRKLALVASSIYAKSDVWLWPLWLGASSSPMIIQHWRQILGCICLMIGAVAILKSLKRSKMPVNCTEST